MVPLCELTEHQILSLTDTKSSLTSLWANIAKILEKDLRGVLHYIGYRYARFAEGK